MGLNSIPGKEGRNSNFDYISEKNMTVTGIKGDKKEEEATASCLKVSQRTKLIFVRFFRNIYIRISYIHVFILL